MNIEDFREFCLKLGPITEEFPFDSTTLVYKIGGKAFALFDVDDFEYVNLKCDPERAVELRESFPLGVRPGYHMNKKHWNSVYPNTDVADELFLELTAHSFALVFAGLPKKVQHELKNEH